jgi:hypothetical protein
MIMSAVAQNTSSENVEKYIETELIPLVGRDGMTWKSKDDKFIVKPYVFIQTRACYNYYDDEGLALVEQDNVLNSGFSIPYALIGFAGKAFDKVTFNLAINAANTGANVLQQAWFDINLKEELRFRIGKFKTPFTNAYLSRLGQTLFLAPPSSLTTSVNIPFDINSVNPIIATGFDLGVEAHGFINNKFEYQVGVFNGTGSGVNTATNTTSDDLGIPSLLYAARVAYMPYGKMPLHQGSPNDLESTYLSIAPSISYNVEANYESSNDLRAGFEVSYIKNKLYLAAEGYLMNVDFVERQQTAESYTFFGSYAQAGYFVTDNIQTALRIDIMDRNSTDDDGLLYMPALGLNYFLMGNNLKLQAMYQFLGKTGYVDEFSENDDDNGMAEHSVYVQLQFAF